MNLISVVIVVKNEADKIRECLESLRDFPEVVVYDNGSSDGTQKIALEFDNVTLHEGTFFGFGPTKKYAVSLAKYDWILSLDADERVSKRLVKELSNISLDSNVVYSILRKNHLCRKVVRFSGWGNDWLLRVFDRRRSNFDDAPVHEKVVAGSSCKVRKLRGHIDHLAVDELSQFLDKVNLYSSIRSREMTKKKGLLVIILKSFFAFFRTYVIRLGFLDGWRGLVISVSNANGVFWKYIKKYSK